MKDECWNLLKVDEDIVTHFNEVDFKAKQERNKKIAILKNKRYCFSKNAQEKQTFVQKEKVDEMIDPIFESSINKTMDERFNDEIIDANLDRDLKDSYAEEKSTQNVFDKHFTETDGDFEF